jgi:hypothetical protein
MKISILKRDFPKRAAVIAVALAAAAGVVAGREKPALEIVETKSPRIEQTAAVDIDLDKLNRADAVAPRNDPFAPRSFAPPPVRQAAASAAAPAAPTAPPLPFVYLGRVTANGKTDVYVVRGDELIDIMAGRQIDDEYRVDAISESSISFTYLPLKMRQSLELPEAGG